MAKIKVPGKLFLAGEYAVTHPGQPAIIMAVDRYLTAQITPSLEGFITSNQYPGKVQKFTRKANGDLLFLKEDRHFDFIMTTLEQVEQLVTPANRKNFTLHFTSQLNDAVSGHKYGLGSSAAVTVATVKALNDFYNLKLSKLAIFKLASLSHLLIQGSGSGGDIAASTFGGLIGYHSYDRQWLQARRQILNIKELLATDWPNLKIENLPWPHELFFEVGWTNQVADTSQLLKKKALSPADQAEFLKESQAVVEALIIAFKNGLHPLLWPGFAKNRQFLLDMAQKRHFTLETPALNQLIELALERNGAAKTSGAGGGDCGFAFFESQNDAIRTRRIWRKNGIIPLQLKLDQES